jgi:uncharacterized protein (TIGR02246 family)
MRRLVLLVCFWLVLMMAAPAEGGPQAQGGAPDNDAAQIRTVLDKQVEAWNRADIPAFMESYEKSPETTFIGASIGKGYERILERYQKNYTNREQMGKLTFNDLEIRLLPGDCGKTDFAVVTGRFHLERTQKGEAKKDDGIFSLVWRKGTEGWKIVLDHTS